jgi:hypothetical protein
MSFHYEVKVYLPLVDNAGEPLPRELYAAVRNELVQEFGGLTAHQRTPVTGLWKPDDESPAERDVLIIYEVLCSRLDRKWWAKYRRKLQALFAQEELLIRAHKIKVL